MKKSNKASWILGVSLGLVMALGALIGVSPAKAGWVGGEGTVPKPFCIVVVQMPDGTFVQYGKYITRPGETGQPMFLPLPKGKPTGICAGGPVIYPDYPYYEEFYGNKKP